ncbi:hypothetical protein N657DRAFT_575327 [Parathielavia appendiculata]|uniref:EF-hand domain-containing protein n=1 Tax=Parathielavia appendiculata TaxID=2587402 RepID=A0AAN6TXK4_9PEZI|nr:hypothetical protein N657DRAFT_575327 [Parathielavia appendiculata]
MSLRSPRSPQQRGFLPISSDPGTAEMQDIPLRTIKSNTSSTGARRVNTEGMDEKHTLFDRAVGGPAGRRRIQKDLKRAGSTGISEGAELNAMGRLYNKIVGFSVVTRYLVYVLPIAILLAVPLIVIPLTGDKDRVRVGHEGQHSLFLLFVWIEISWLALWAGKMVAHLLPFIFMFFCGVISSGTRKYATVLRALEIPLSLFFWGLASWLSFKFMLRSDGATYTWEDIMERILLSLFLSSAVLLGEKFIVQLISITYHQRSFANRIQDSKREIFLLGLMYEASRTLFPMYCDEFAHEDYIIADSIDVILSGGKVNPKQAAPMRLVGEVGRLGDKITSVFGNIASEVTGKQVFNPNSAHSVVVEALEKIRSSEAMARRIWMSFVVEGQEALSMDDIIEVMGPAHREEAEECFNAIDADQNGDISLDEMIRKVVEIGKERKAIANSMKDIGQALMVFDKVLLFVVLIIVIIIFLAVFQSSLIATLTTAGTTLLSLSFVFAVTTQEFLGSCIFLFVKHPYDVGDRVDITGPEKEQLVVEKISLLYTVFTRIDKMQVVQVPNIILNNLWIENVTRSKAMKEVIDVNVSFDTSFEDIELLRLEMENFVRSPENSRDFQPDIAIGVGGVGDCDKLTLKIAMKHKSNWHNEVVRATRRSKFMCALAVALKRIPINAPGGGGDPLGGPSNPTYSVAVTDEFAANARSKSEEEKKAKKLANQSAEDSANSDATAAAEQRAAEHINASNPVVEALEDWGYENTLVSRDPSADRNRVATEVGASLSLAHSTSRSDRLSGSGGVLSNRESQRGRRKAGETLPPHALDDNISMPAIQLTRSSTTSTSRGPTDNRSFDVERHAGAAGIPAPAGSPYTTWAAYNANAGLTSPPPGGGGAGVDAYPGSPPMPHLTLQQPGAPGTQAQGGQAGTGRPLVGARSRAASVSQGQGGAGAAGPSGRI